MRKAEALAKAQTIANKRGETLQIIDFNPATGNLWVLREWSPSDVEDEQHIKVTPNAQTS